MMNHLRFAVYALLVLFVDQLLLGISGNLGVSILLPVAVYLATKDGLPGAIAFAFAVGILSDMAALRSIPLMAIFLMLSVLLANYLSRRYLEFRSILAIILTASALYVFQILLMSVLYVGSFNLVLLYSFVVNSLTGALVILIISRRGLIGK